MSKATLALPTKAVKGPASAVPAGSAALRRWLARWYAGEEASATLPANLSGQAYLISRLPEQALRAGVVWLVPSNRDLEPAQELASFFLKDLPAPPVILRFPEDHTRWITVQAEGTPSVLVVAREHLSLALPSREALAQGTVELKAGENRKPMDLLRRLEASGYEPGPLPDRAGWFVKTGGTLTVVSLGAAWLISWDGDRIESLAPLSLGSGTAGQPCDSIAILPYRLTPDPGTRLEDYVAPGHALIASTPDLKPKHKRSLSINPLRTSPLLAPVPLFGAQWEELARYVKDSQAKGFRVTALTTEANTLPHRLPEGAALDIAEVPQAVAFDLEGFSDELSKVRYLSDREITGAKRRRPRRNLAAYEQLEPGDYLVHIDHGIGRFVGLTSQTIDEVTREYFVVEYAESDKLYVPIEHTDRLSRYLGSPHPTLERLSSQAWFQVTKRVKAEAAALAGELLKLYAKRQSAAVSPWQPHPDEEKLSASFPYPLTSDQLKAWAEIAGDLSRPQPMDRLVCGDVGFGKTEVAVRAAFRAVRSGTQVAILAPTTILAQQHFDTFSDRLSPFRVNVALVSRAQDAPAIKRTLAAIQSGSVDVVIGTHRLLARDVHFKNLGLLIVDEEQRFGVKQKEELKAVKPALHVLSLSATPIPRTLHLAVSNVRDLSIINTPPFNRLSVSTEFTEDLDETVHRAIQLELDRKGQAYYLVQHIQDLARAEHRLKQLFPSLRLGLIHGRMKPSEVAKTMHAFDERNLDVLIATTIIENGIDLPNVNTLIVEQAEVFGLADLYQLKGRVGRGATKAYAYFLVSKERTAAADKRLEALAAAERLGSGLSLALKDMELRGAGAILGREQHGQVSAVGLHLYGQLLAQAVEELSTGLPTPTIPEVRLRLPIEGRIMPALIPNEDKRIQAYQRLASVREPVELNPTAEELLGRPLTDSADDRLMRNLLTLLELKLYAEHGRLQEVSCQNAEEGYARFSLKFMEAPPDDVIERLTKFDERWHKVESTWQAEHPLAAGAWVPWLKASLKLLGK